jgi:hypothetical protein
MPDAKNKQYLIETIQVGNFFKVSAADPETGCEVSLMAPLSSTKEMREKLAVQKLEYRLRM